MGGWYGRGVGGAVARSPGAVTSPVSRLPSTSPKNPVSLGWKIGENRGKTGKIGENRGKTGKIGENRVKSGMSVSLAIRLASY